MDLAFDDNKKKKNFIFVHVLTKIRKKIHEFRILELYCSMKLKYLLYYSLLFLTACHMIQNNVIWIDNPSKKILDVTIFNQNYLVPAEGGVEITLEDGVYDIDVVDDSSKQLLHHINQISITENGILNVTNESYVLLHQAFVTKTDVNLNTVKVKNEVTIDEYTYKGDIELIGKDSFFIPQRWQRGINEELALITSQNVEYAFITKIYRKSDFKTDFMRNTGR